MDAGLLKASQSSDAKMLDCEFTVVEGPYARRKFWQMFTVAGGKLDDKGQSKGWNISKSAFRAMIDSALGLDPKDESPAAKQKRVSRAEAARRHRVRGAHHGRARVGPAIQGCQQARERGAAGRAAIRKPSCAARPCRPTRSTPSRAKRRKLPSSRHPRGACRHAAGAPVGVPWASQAAPNPPRRSRDRAGLAQRLKPARTAADDRRRVAGPCHA